jgi:hypothetical protein
MTLILVLPTRDGIVMASDGQVTAGMVRTTGQKILCLNERCLWAASGELALIQRVEERLKTLPPNNPLAILRDQICLNNKAVRNRTTCSWIFGQPFLPQDPDRLLQLHPGDFVFAECVPNRAVLHVLVNGTAEWITDRPFASGSGDLFAYALLQKYQGLDLDMEEGALLAYKVLEEAIAVGAYGLGSPIDIWKISNSGIKQLNDSEKAALEDASRTLRQYEIELLMGAREQGDSDAR